MKRLLLRRSDKRGPWNLLRKKFAHHRLAVSSIFLLQALYFIALFAEVFAPYPKNLRNLDYIYCAPQLPRFNLSLGWHVYWMRSEVDPVTLRRIYIEDRNRPLPLSFFVKGDCYFLWGALEGCRRIFSIDHAELRGWQRHEESKGMPTFYLLGTDAYGRDILSQMIYGARVSLSIGLAAIVILFTIGASVGGISGYLGGRVDNLIQRGIEILNSFPQLPMWMALAAVMPREWSAVQTYFAMTIVLSLLGWTGLARVVRGKVLALRENDYVVAARLSGCSDARIITRHLLPGLTSHIIVVLTMSVPSMILAETSLSFLGLGLRAPVVSWGVLLQPCIDVAVIRHYPWLLSPVLIIVVTVLSFNFVGDGLRDAADPNAVR